MLCTFAQRVKKTKVNFSYFSLVIASERERERERESKSVRETLKPT